MTEATHNDQNAPPPTWDERTADYEAHAEPLPRSLEAHGSEN